ncbi:hypothetical protein HK18_01025 [Commensalibacter intestini]|uniref:Halovibrin HvnA n=1 Tax=Commensalibacter intestini TaxID=479936 RepID=A0A251ZT29_9PROT|nr:hypothetical protein [Commensalibacter intestini]OUI77827.1 hypothetical protein HK18_01025 [Commensalibacter intestini]
MKLRNVVSVASILGAILSFNLQQEAKANVADDLNTNYNKIVTNCGSSDQPAYECSGNLVRLTSVSQYNAWDPNPHSVALQSVSFTYLRHDIKVELGYNKLLSGIIYYPPMITPADKEVAQIKCAFPMDGWSSSRSDGCKRPIDNKTCQDLGIHTAEGWYQDFMSRPIADSNRYVNQCGFSMTIKGENIAQDFNENLKIINNIFDETMLGADGQLPSYRINGYNEITIKPFPSNDQSQIINPEKLPIQAFFYVSKDGNSGLADARYYQQQYYQKAHIIVPIVKVNENDPANISFSYNPEDRGVTVADELNANYNKVVDNCGGKDNPAFQCSGILFRQTSYSSASHAWDPNELSIKLDGVSFAYLRKDIHFRNFMNARNSGFIYYPSQQAPSDIENAKISCAFPTIGWSNDRPYGRCGSHTSYPTTSVECQQQGIYTADDWYKKFADTSVVGLNKFFSQCGFDVSNCGHDIATAFSESIKAHNLAEANSNLSGSGSNEIIVRNQETDASGKSVHPETLPLQAFYYQNATGLTEAQKYQQDYYNTTGKVVPVVYMNTTDFNNISFEYKATDQVVKNN